jgi:DNA-binding SARP family transcriptional activator
MARLTLTLLGGFRAQLGTGATLSLPSKKSQALLAYLAVCQARRTTRDSLADLLWGDTGEVQARQSLRQALAGLRRVLPRTKPAIVVADHQAIALNAAATDVDALRFERLVSQARPEALQEAVALFRGDLLEGLRLKEPRFEEWLRADASEFAAGRRPRWSSYPRGGWERRR